MFGKEVRVIRSAASKTQGNWRFLEADLDWKPTSAGSARAASVQPSLLAMLRFSNRMEAWAVPLVKPRVESRVRGVWC